MHAQPQRTLKRLLKQYGQELIDDPRRTEALLRDLCGQHTREIFVLVNAQKQRVPNELRSAPTWMPRQATYSRLSRMLQTKLALTEDAADWAVMAWATALDLDTPPKGEGWSWLPEPLRAPAPPSSRKSRSKKRQNSPSSVQYPKENPRQSSSRQAKARADRAEKGWSFPKLPFTFPIQFWKMPIVWANLLPWVALLTATIFLLAVVYWTSATRGQQTAVDATVESETPVVESSANGENALATPIYTNLTPAPALVSPPGDYLSDVITLPTVANVNVVTLYIRQQPTIESIPLDFLAEGVPVHVIAFSSDGEWSQIDQPIAGWVSNDFLLFQSQDATQTSVLLDVHPRRTQRYEVSVRAEPNASAAETTKLAPDAPVIVAAVMGDPATWYQIADPAIGWVAANDLAPATP